MERSHRREMHELLDKWWREYINEIPTLGKVEKRTLEGGFISEMMRINDYSRENEQHVRWARDFVDQFLKDCQEIRNGEDVFEKETWEQ